MQLDTASPSAVLVPVAVSPKLCTLEYRQLTHPQSHPFVRLSTLPKSNRSGVDAFELTASIPMATSKVRLSPRLIWHMDFQVTTPVHSNRPV
jgi:hypothetical protein